MPLVVGVGLMLDRPRPVDSDISAHFLRGSLDPEMLPTPPVPARAGPWKPAGHASRRGPADTTFF